MSAGSPIVTLRIPRDFLEELDATIARNNLTVKGKMWDRTDWILKCIKDRLRHQKAGNSAAKRRKPKPKPTTHGIW